MNSGGSSSGRAPVQPQPQGSQTTPYGNATPFNPMFTSYLPPEGSTASAQLGDVPRQEFGAPTPLLRQQQAAPMVADKAGAGGISSSMRRMLAEMMVRAERDKYLARINKESAGGGSQARGSFGPGGNSGGTKGGGLY